MSNRGNFTCPTRPAGDSTNAQASTEFVTSAIDIYTYAKCDNIATLRQNPVEDGKAFIVGGYYQVGDGASGIFYPSPTVPKAQFTGSIAMVGGAAVLTVSSIVSGIIYAGMKLTGDLIATQLYIARQLTGTNGGVGTYALYDQTGNSPILTIPSSSMTGTMYWDNGGTVILPTGGDGTRAWLREISSDVNVKWFGATGDGTTDDTTAIQNAINLGQPTYIPGTSNYYRLTNQINGNSSTAFILRGDGSPSTRLVWEGSNGFYWNNTITTDFYGLTKRCQITGMSLLTTGTGGGAQAIFLRRSAVVEPAITIEDIFIAGKDVSTHYWDKGIVLTNVVGSWIKDYWFSGKAGDATSLSGLEYYQDVNAGSMVHWLESASIKWAQNGISIHANGSIGIEGVIIDNTLVVACRVPIWLNGSGASGGYKPPYVAITNAQLSVDAVTNPQQCIYSNKYAQVFIDNSVFYGSHLTSAYPLIDITDSVDVNINASYFVNFAASLERSGVRLNGNGYRNKISGCHFDSLLNGIEINGTQTDCVIGAGNTFANVTNRYSGSATSSASYFRRSMSGVATVASGSRVNFGCTFNVTPAVTVTHSGTSVVLGSSVSGVDTTGFTLNHSNGATVTSFYWTAIGD